MRNETNLAANAFKRALALTASKKPNYAKGFPLLAAAERLGHAEATYALATWYLFGRHVAPSSAKALVLLKRAVRRGSADAAFDLAIAFEQGKIIERDERKAFQLYPTSAIRHRQPLSHPATYGFREAAYEVSRCYYHGIGVTADRRAGMIWKIESKAFRSPKRTARPPIAGSSSPRRSPR